MKNKILLAIAVMLFSFLIVSLVLAANQTLLFVSGYAIYTNGTPYSGSMQIAINETGGFLSNSTVDGRFAFNLTGLNLTQGKKYRLVITTSDNPTTQMEKEFVAG